MRIRAMSDLKNLLHFLRLLVLRNRKKSFEKVRSVRFITFRRFFPDGGAGGGEPFSLPTGCCLVLSLTAFR